MVKKYGSLIKSVAFLLVLLMVVCSFQGIFGMDGSRSYENIKRYLLERRGTLDAVYIGGSDVHAFWQPLFGWSEEGIAVWNYSIDSIPISAVKYLAVEARRTQPQALLIISLSTFKKSSAAGSMEAIHRFADFTPFTLNKVRFIDAMAQGTEYTGLKKAEFYFPIIRFHTRWDSLSNWTFGQIIQEHKSSMHTPAFRNTVADQSGAFVLNSEKGEVPEDVTEALNELLDYFDEENLSVLFVKVPQASTQVAQARMNTLEDMVTERGYPCLDLMENYEDVGIDLHSDFYNDAHTNVHGSLKYSRYLADYLVENYGFEDKRGLSGWKSWDDAADLFFAELGPSLLPIEAEGAPRDYSLSAPKMSTPKAKDRTITVSWAASEGARSYAIFRRIPDTQTNWAFVAAVDADTLSYTDTGLPAQTKCYYTVVPCRETAEGLAYGNYTVNGLSATTGR